MVRVVLDTDVLVSGLLSPRGAAAAVLNTVIGGRVELLYDDRIIEEYREALLRPCFGFDKSSVGRFLSFIEQEGEWVEAMPMGIGLKSGGEEMPFLECAVSGRADALVTGNVRRFPKAALQVVKIKSQRDFLEESLSVMSS